MEVLRVLATYTALTLFGLLAARVLTYVLIGRMAMPSQPDKKPMATCAVESLHMATELRIDANAVYKQLSGGTHKR